VAVGCGHEPVVGRIDVRGAGTCSIRTPPAPSRSTRPMPSLTPCPCRAASGPGRRGRARRPRR
jgi:hypothetical protein